MGIAAERISFGQTLEDSCAREGISIDDYLAAHDPTIPVTPFPGVEEMLRLLSRWALCSNKLGAHARRELEQFGWRPDVAMFPEDFGGPKRLAPVLQALGAAAPDVVFVGDSDHDRACARAAGVTFALAGWNPRAEPVAGDVVLDEPAQVIELLAR